jgi:hypothetical protein
MNFSAESGLVLGAVKGKMSECDGLKPRQVMILDGTGKGKRLRST